jgi:hypothetical protein
MFGKPNNALRSALDAGEVAIKEHRLIVKPELKEVVLHANKCLVVLLPLSHILDGHNISRFWV